MPATAAGTMDRRLFTRDGARKFGWGGNSGGAATGIGVGVLGGLTGGGVPRSCAGGLGGVGADAGTGVYCLGTGVGACTTGAESRPTPC